MVCIYLHPTLPICICPWDADILLRSGLFNVAFSKPDDMLPSEFYVSIPTFRSQHGPLPSQWEQFKGRMREDPLIPFFTAATIGALSIGVARSFMKGDSKGANNMMRARVLAQGLAIGAVAWSSYKITLQ